MPIMTAVTKQIPWTKFPGKLINRRKTRKFDETETKLDTGFSQPMRNQLFSIRDDEQELVWGIRIKASMDDVCFSYVWMILKDRRER